MQDLLNSDIKIFDETDNITEEPLNQNFIATDKKFGILEGAGHKHDGTAGNATKISYNDLMDKPVSLAPADHTHDGTTTQCSKIDYMNLINKPSLGTAAATSTSDYAPANKGVTNGNTHVHSNGDGAQIDHNNLYNKGSFSHSQIDNHINSKTDHGLVSLKRKIRMGARI